MKQYECPKCYYGYVFYYDGEGFPQTDACYHCCSTGYVNYNPNPTLEELNEELREIADAALEI